MPAKPPIHSDNYPASFYYATAKELTQHPSLEASVDTDVCIVGGGFTGVNTAIELAQLGYKVVLLEAHRIGWGASGRNGGELIRGIGHNLEQFESTIGKEGIRAIKQMGLEAVDIVKQRITNHHIDCDLQMGFCDLAMKPRHMQELQDEIDDLRALGYRHELRLLPKSELHEVIGSNRYQGGLLDMGSGHLHPLNLVLGEARVAKQLGVEIYEHSAATEIIKGDTVRVKTASGQVNSRFLVLAGNAYIGHKLEPHIGGKVLPAGSYLLATEPLPQSVCEQIIPHNMAFADMSIALDYFRLSADNRLLFGGLCTYSGKDPKDICRALRPNMERVFPRLKGVNIEYEWGGMIGIGANRMPQIGQLPDSPNIYFAQAYSGHGVNATHMAARVLAEAINNQTARFDIFAAIQHMTFPGGPALRSPILAAGMLYHRMKDLF
ncbi:NAD(P)/FAD-dependent oxidoreductase [Shewanella sp. GXUN23E]|uniref:NAD(P)/FAD-dependent oxidoreductase n=1 Tax=Shewanella sp. GXUN23E TaxID=3422498 RepID=UPI003D7EF894